MKIQTFLDMQKEQKKLQEKIKIYKKDTVLTLTVGILDELLEFLRETKYTYKNWKPEPKNTEKMFEEYADIWFMFFKFVNTCQIQGNFTPIVLEDIENFNFEFLCISAIINTTQLFGINNPYKTANIFFLQNLSNSILKLGTCLGITEEQLYLAFEKKLEKNYTRIGQDWL